MCVLGAVQCTLLLLQQTIPQAERVVTPVVWVARHFPLCYDVFVVYELLMLVIGFGSFNGGDLPQTSANG